MRVITAPTELLTISQVAYFLKIDYSSAEEDTLTALIPAAREWCQEYLQRMIGVQTIEDTFDGFPSVGNRSIPLKSPFISLTSVKYTDTNNEEQTMTEDTDFYLSDDTDPPEIRPVGSWPSALATANSVKVRYSCGYQNQGDSPQVSVDLPFPVRQAMLMMIADMYDNRSGQVSEKLTSNPTLERLLSPYRLRIGI